MNEITRALKWFADNATTAQRNEYTKLSKSEALMYVVRAYAIARINTDETDTERFCFSY